MELNPRIKLFIILAIIILILTGIPFRLILGVVAPIKQTVNTTPQIIIYRNITNTVFVTPTIDGKTYFAGEYQNGTRLLAHPFSWYRTNVNLPNNSLKISANVYDYRIFPNYHYKDLEYTDSPNDIYATQYPDNPNDEFIFVFVSIYADEHISNTPNVWLPNQKNFALSIGGITYFPVNYSYARQIAEMQELTNQGNNYFIQAYGQYREYTTRNNRNELYNNGSSAYEPVGNAGEVSRTLFYIPKGSSNMIDGYLLFEIPKDTSPKTIRILGSFYSFGYSEWKLSQNPDELGY
jgi:hypothetical protein